MSVFRHGSQRESTGSPPSSSDDDDDSAFDRHFPPGDDDLDPDDFLSVTRRGGHLFHSHGSSQYPLPPDIRERQGQIVLHDVLHRTLGRNYVGPVPEALAFIPGRQTHVLDLATGSGQWPTEMALEFPHVQFFGLDLEPLPSLYSLDNLQFVSHDINQPIGLADSSVDVVHARNVWLGVLDYNTMLQEMARILRPGGLFLSCEWGIYCAFHPGCNRRALAHAPGACEFFAAVVQCLRRRGIESPAPLIPYFIDRSGQFDSYEAKLQYLPIGSWCHDPHWRSIGRAFRAVLIREMEAWKPLLRESGCSEQEVEELCERYMHDLRRVNGMVGVYHMVWARKR